MKLVLKTAERAREGRRERRRERGGGREQFYPHKWISANVEIER